MLLHVDIKIIIIIIIINLIYYYFCSLFFIYQQNNLNLIFQYNLLRSLVKLDVWPSYRMLRC
jgi:hypothetical protein